MDIFKWADNYPEGDYYEPSTGNIYKCKDYKKGITPEGIYVVKDNEIIGIVRKVEEA